MKNQYYGDINDYRKYGLLRSLTRDTGLHLGVCWMLTSDDERSDGEKVGYLVRIPADLGTQSGHLGTESGVPGQEDGSEATTVSGCVSGSEFGVHAFSFPTGRAGESDDVCVVYHAVADGVGDRGVTEGGVPLGGG